MFHRQKKNNLSDKNYLELIPVKFHSFEVDDKGLVTIILPKFKSEALKKTLVKMMKYPNRKIKFDAFGSETWLQINGENSVGSIGQKLVEKFGENIHPVEERLTKFLTQLYEHKFISFNNI